MELLHLSDWVDNKLRALIDQKRTRGADGNDVLTVLIQARDEDGVGLTEEELIGQTTLLFTAGYDTTANATTWALFLLSQHPDVMADLFDELDGKLHGDAPIVGGTRIVGHVLKAGYA